MFTIPQDLNSVYGALDVVEMRGGTRPHRDLGHHDKLGRVCGLVQNQRRCWTLFGEHHSLCEWEDTRSSTLTCWEDAIDGSRGFS